MNKCLVGSAVALALALPVSAFGQSQSDISELKSQVEELNQKIENLEEKEAQSSWTDKISMKGDFRYKFEGIYEDGQEDRDRQRIRARLFVNAQVHDTADVGLEISTGGSNPRSRDATLSSDGSPKSITLRQAYAKWRPMDGITVTAGKATRPWAINAIEYFHDSDYMPEGLSAKFSNGPFFGSAWWIQLAERGADDDTSMWGGQVGYAGDLFYANVLYKDFQDIEGFNPCFNGNCNGNTVDAAGNLVYDYNIIELRGGVKLSGFDIFASFAQNGDADTEDTAYSYGVSYGKVKDPGTWQVGVIYQDMEKDALYGGMIDATFAGGRTAHDGYAIKGAYGLSKNWVLEGFWADNDIDKTGNERGYQRYQVNFLWKF